MLPFECTVMDVQVLLAPCLCQYARLASAHAWRHLQQTWTPLHRPSGTAARPAGLPRQPQLPAGAHPLDIQLVQGAEDTVQHLHPDNAETANHLGMHPLQLDAEMIITSSRLILWPTPGRLPSKTCMTAWEVIKMLAARAAGAGNSNGKVSLTKMYKEASGQPSRIERSGRVNAAAAAREQRTSPPAGGACQTPVLLCDRPCSLVHSAGA